jgi:hypothetical protein
VGWEEVALSHANFLELRHGEVRRIPLLGTGLHRGQEGVGFMAYLLTFILMLLLSAGAPEGGEAY